MSMLKGIVKWFFFTIFFLFLCLLILLSSPLTLLLFPLYLLSFFLSLSFPFFSSFSSVSLFLILYTVQKTRYNGYKIKVPLSRCTVYKCLGPIEFFFCFWCANKNFLNNTPPPPPVLGGGPFPKYPHPPLLSVEGPALNIACRSPGFRVRQTPKLYFYI